MKKKYLLFILLISGFVTSYSQSTKTKNTIDQKKEISNKAQITTEKKSIKDRPLKVEMITTEKKTVNKPKNDAKLEKIDKQ